MTSVVGRSVPRREDQRFLTGRGSYVADGTAGGHHVAFVRSREAAALIRGIDVEQALAVPGVVGVYGARDLGLAKNRIEVLTRPSPEFSETAGFEMFPQHIPVLAEDRVTYVGQPIAIVVAQDRYSAEDGVERVRVDYQPVPAVVDAEEALQPGAPSVHPEMPDNEAGHLHIEFGSAELPADAVTVEGRYRVSRHGAVPMETRGVHAWYDPQRERIELRTSTQIPHMVRQSVCGALGVVEALVENVSVMPVGDPADEGTVFGPLANHKQKESVEGYIRQGVEEGATIAYGGGDVDGLPGHVADGAYVQPTVFRDVDNSMTIAQEEIFGPVLQVIPYDTVDEAVQIANDSDYGLAGAVYSADPEAALKVAQRVRTGTMGINWYAFDPSAPFGGFKNSGLGRENGPEGLEAFCELQSVLMPLGWEAPAE